MNYILIITAIVIHIFYYISAIKTHTLDYFFPWGSVHNQQGWDFYQIPNGVHSFLKGGELTGIPPLGIPSYSSFGSENVYHPFFTLVLGYPLQLLRPQTAFHLWFVAHAVVTIILVTILYLRFKSNKHIVFALFIYLIFFPQYLEIWEGQYHFLLNAAVFFLLLGTLKKRDSVKDGILFCVSLLVKPIGLLWIPTLLLHKRWKTVLYGIMIFIILTLPFSINGHDVYYIGNLIQRIRTPFGGPPSIFTLDVLLRYWKMPSLLTMGLKIVVAVALLIVQKKFKISMFQSLFLWVSYYLLFYDLVFEYHYTILAPFMAIGILTQKEFQTKAAKIASILFALPTPFFFMHFFQIGASGKKITDNGWIIIVLFRIIPLILFDLYLIYQRTTRRNQVLNGTLPR